jgi:hypothetical protein
MKTQDLTGLALDWAVAKCLHDDDFLFSPAPYLPDENGQPAWFNPSTDWAQGGPIIERETIGLEWGPRLKEQEWLAWTPAPEQAKGEAHAYGPTPLIAAMRCYVASKMGDEIEVPDDLI